MSQSTLYHAFGIRGVTYRSTSFLGNAIIFNVETTNRHVIYCGCGHRHCTFKGQKMRFLRHPVESRRCSK